jgi:hypothetical protein
MLSSCQDTIQSPIKPLGAYLIEAGLLSEAQVQVILADQLATDMKFGEIVAVRGWVKQQTIDYLMEKVIMPERRKLSEPPQPYPQTPPQPISAASAVAARLASASTEQAYQPPPKAPAYSFVAKKPTPKTAPKPTAKPAPPQPVKPDLFNADTEDFEWLG